MLIRTNIYLDNKMLASLRQIANFEKKSVAEVVRGMIKDAIKVRPMKKMNAVDAMREMAEYAVKNKTRDIEGKTDVALNHDYYLYVEPYEKKNSR